VESIVDIKEYLTWIESNCTANTIFRGQPEKVIVNGNLVQCELMPRLGRTHKADLKSIEYQLFDSFRRAASGYTHQPVEDEWDWLALAQHHGLATRLLDWTKNPLAALWFGSASVSPDDSSGSIVWAFDPASSSSEHVSQTEESQSPFRIESVMLYRPVQITRRIGAQMGCFTIHPMFDGKLQKLNDSSSIYGNIRCLKIESRHFNEIRSGLKSIGISQSTLFPDLDGVAVDLNLEQLY